MCHGRGLQLAQIPENLDDGFLPAVDYILCLFWRPQVVKKLAAGAGKIESDLFLADGTKELDLLYDTLSKPKALPIEGQLHS